MSRGPRDAAYLAASAGGGQRGRQAALRERSPCDPGRLIRNPVAPPGVQQPTPSPNAKSAFATTTGREGRRHVRAPEWSARHRGVSRSGHEVQSVNELVEEADEKQLNKNIARYGRVDLLCIDELGYMERDPRGAELPSQVLTEREETNSVAIASNESFDVWTKTFTDPRLCAAIVDRLTFNGTIIETGTDSYRLASTRARAEEPVKAGRARWLPILTCPTSVKSDAVSTSSSEAVPLHRARNTILLMLDGGALPV